MIEAVVVGRVGVDFTPTTPRTSLASADSFSRAVGGFAGNIGTGLARLGVRTAIVSAVGDDGHGDHVREFLSAEGADVGGIMTVAGSRTQVAFVEVWPPDRFPVTFYRSTPAPETRLTTDHLAMELIETAPVVIVSGALLAEEPCRSTVAVIFEARRAARGRRPERSWTILDLDWRPTLWPDAREAPALVARAAAMSDAIIGSDEEFAAVLRSPEIATDDGPSMIVLKHGPDGVSLVRDGDTRRIAGLAVDVLCGTGAGDGLTAAFVAGMLAGLDPVVAVERGNAAGAIVATRLMCSTAMPTADEIDHQLGLIPVASQGAPS